MIPEAWFSPLKDSQHLLSYLPWLVVVEFCNENPFSRVRPTPVDHCITSCTPAALSDYLYQDRVYQPKDQEAIGNHPSDLFSGTRAGL